MIRIILMAHHQKQLFKKAKTNTEINPIFLPENHFEKTLDMCLSYYYIYYYILNTTTIGITFCKIGSLSSWIILPRSQFVSALDLIFPPFL